MARFVKVSDPQVVINNVSVAVKPNSVMYTEGLGEQKSETQSSGAGEVDKVDSQNAETLLSKVAFVLLPTQPNIEVARELKELNSEGGSSTISITDPASGFTRVFQFATLNNDYEVNPQTDGEIAVEFMATTAR